MSIYDATANVLFVYLFILQKNTMHVEQLQLL